MVTSIAVGGKAEEEEKRTVAEGRIGVGRREKDSE